MARVLHLISSNERRGAEVFATELAEHLRGAGHDVRVLAIEPTRSDQRLDVEVAGRHRLDPLGIRRALAAARWSDIVVSFGSTSLITGSVVARLARRPFVYRNIGDPSVWGTARLAGLRVGAPLRSTAAIVALYPEAKANLVRMYGLDPASTRVIPRGVPATRFSPASPEQRAAARAALGLTDTTPCLAYVGALSPEKDPLLAIEVMRRLPADVHLVVAGGGPLTDEMAAAAAELRGRVHLLGAVRDVRDVLAATDLLILTSRTEGIPGAVIEAGLSGRATVTTAVGGVPHTIVDGVTGRLVELDSPAAFADAVSDALARSTELGAGALEKCRAEYSMASVGAAWEQLIEDIVRPPTGSSGSVLHVTASPQRRGAETFAVQLGDALDRLAWHSSTVAVSGTHGPSSLPIRILGRGRFRPLSLARLARAARRSDVVIAHGSNSLIPTCVTACLSRRPFVYRIIGDPAYWGRVRFASLRIGLPLRRAAAVVALTAASADWIVQHYGIHPDRVLVIPNAVDVTDFAPRAAELRAAARSSYGAGPDDLVLGFVGSLSAEKRPDWAVRAATAIPGSLLLVAGEGHLRPQLEQLAARGPGRVAFLGSLADPDALVSSLDALLLPSETEGMPAVVIEAGLCGVPTVATDVGAVREIIDAFGAGTVVSRDSYDEFAEAVGTCRRVQPDAPPAEARARFDMANAAVAWSTMLTRCVASAGGRPGRSAGSRR